ncbi:hypothetical protein AAVH_06239 [Aphelenchoides avenae]|nr:hypothetical protein AAVH_06239 [Aphelenchus avenae]
MLSLLCLVFSLQWFFVPLSVVFLLVQCRGSKKPATESAPQTAEAAPKSGAPSAVTAKSATPKSNQPKNAPDAVEACSTDLGTLPLAHSPPRTGCGTTPAPSAATDKKTETRTEQNTQPTQTGKDAPDAKAAPEPVQNEGPKIERTTVFSVRNKKFSDEPESVATQSEENPTERKPTTQRTTTTKGPSAALHKSRECKTQKSVTQVKKAASQKQPVTKK